MFASFFTDFSVAWLVGDWRWVAAGRPMDDDDNGGLFLSQKSGSGIVCHYMGSETVVFLFYSISLKFIKFFFCQQYSVLFQPKSGRIINKTNRFLFYFLITWCTFFHSFGFLLLRRFYGKLLFLFTISYFLGFFVIFYLCGSPFALEKDVFGRYLFPDFINQQ